MVIKSIFLLILVCVAAYTDIFTRRIPNRLTSLFVILGLVVNIAMDFPSGLVTSVLGLIAGFLIFFIPYLMKAMGAGDVKLMAAIGAITGWRSVIFIALFTALAGGVIVLVQKAYTGGIRRTLKRTVKMVLFYFFSLVSFIMPVPTIKNRTEKYRIDTTDKKNDFIPYAVAIAAGTIITIILSNTGAIQGFPI